jgi:hypothetical protein
VNAINPGNHSTYIRTECFSWPALGTLGNLGRNTLRGPGLVTLRFSGEGVEGVDYEDYEGVPAVTFAEGSSFHFLPWFRTEYCSPSWLRAV